MGRVGDLEMKVGGGGGGMVYGGWGLEKAFSLFPNPADYLIWILIVAPRVFRQFVISRHRRLGGMDGVSRLIPPQPLR